MFGSNLDSDIKNTAIAIMGACKTIRREASEVLVSCLDHHAQKQQDEIRDYAKLLAAVGGRSRSVKAKSRVVASHVVESNMESTELV